MRSNKNLQILFLSGVLYFAAGCVHFVNPQPIDQPEEKVFPREYRGTYVADKDTIRIEAKRYYSSFERSFYGSVHDFDAVRIKGNKAYFIDAEDEQNPIGYGVIQRQWGDSIEGVYREGYQHNLGNSIQLRRVDAGYLLSSKHHSSWWDLGLLFLKDDTLIALQLDVDTFLARIDPSHIIYRFNSKGQLVGDLEGVIRKDSIPNVSHGNVYVDLDWTRKQWDAEIAKGIFAEKRYRELVRID